MVELEVSIDRRADVPVGLRLASGCVVRQVTPGTPAALAGFHPGDVLLALNDHPLSRRYDYYRRLEELGPGQLRLAFRRTGPSLPALEEAAEKEKLADDVNPIFNRLRRRLGFGYHIISFEPLTDVSVTGASLGSRNDVVLITQVAPGSPASKHLALNDRILAIGGQIVSTKEGARFLMAHFIARRSRFRLLIERPQTPEAVKQLAEESASARPIQTASSTAAASPKRTETGPVVRMEAWVGELEPWRVRMVEPIRILSREERLEALVAARWNPFLLESKDILVDLLTDSGMSALSLAQWGAMLAAEESYAGSGAIHRFRAAFLAIMPNLSSIYPVHQGRAAERVLADVFAGPHRIIPSNGHFFTTRRNLNHRGIETPDLPCAASRDAGSEAGWPFKGDMDLAGLRVLLEAKRDRIPAVFVTVTNNACGGQPVSLACLVQLRALCQEFGKPLFMDACRFAENAMFIKLREPGQAGRSLSDIVRDMFAQVDGMWLSAKKDLLCSIGGCLALRPDLAELDMAAQSLIVMGEGALTYGGLAARDLDAIAVGLRECLDETYLRHRLACLTELGRGLSTLGVPIYRPVGGSTIFINASALLPAVPRGQFPGLALANALYLEGGIRAGDAGSFQLGAAAGCEYTRLCFPRRLHTSAHIRHVLTTFRNLMPKLGKICPGYAVVGKESPANLRFFCAHLQPLAHPPG